MLTALHSLPHAIALSTGNGTLRTAACLMTLALAAHAASAQTTGTPAPAGVVASDAPLLAAGYEPGWTLSITAQTLILRTGLHLQEPPPALMVPTPSPTFTPAKDGATLRYTATTDKGPLQASFLRQACANKLSGVIYPYAVNVSYAGTVYQGCGGDPALLLQGAEWRVEDIGAEAVVTGQAASKAVTLQFAANGQLRGMALCNRLEGRYTLTDERLRLLPTLQPIPTKANPGTTTAKPCPPERQQQEALLMDILQSTTRWDFTGDGALTLGTADGRRILARRALP